MNIKYILLLKEMMYNENMGDGGFSNSINFNELNMFHQNRQNLIKVGQLYCYSMTKACRPMDTTEKLLS